MGENKRCVAAQKISILSYSTSYWRFCPFIGLLWYAFQLGIRYPYAQSWNVHSAAAHWTCISWVLSTRAMTSPLLTRLPTSTLISSMHRGSRCIMNPSNAKRLAVYSSFVLFFVSPAPCFYTINSGIGAGKHWRPVGWFYCHEAITMVISIKIKESLFIIFIFYGLRNLIIICYTVCPARFVPASRSVPMTYNCFQHLNNCCLPASVKAGSQSLLVFVLYAFVYASGNTTFLFVWWNSPAHSDNWKSNCLCWVSADLSPFPGCAAHY